MRLKIGLTGGIGSGKSTVARILVCMGYPVFYADIAARELMDSDPIVRSTLLDFLGPDFLSNGSWNRPKIAKEIFSNDAKRKTVNDIIHPAVRERFDLFFQAQCTQLVFQEAAILFETGGYRLMDENILVTAPEWVRIERVMNRDGCNKEDVLLRMNRQWTDKEKRNLAGIELRNDEVSPLLKQVEICVHELTKRI